MDQRMHEAGSQPTRRSRYQDLARLKVHLAKNCSTLRRAKAMIDPCGLTPGAVHSKLASARYRFLNPCTRPKESVAHLRLSSPIGQEENKWMVIRLAKPSGKISGSFETSSCEDTGPVWEIPRKARSAPAS